MSDLKMLSTSALSKKLVITKHNLDEMLLACKYIKRNNDGFEITELGKANGGDWQTHQRFGTYIVWPEDIIIPNKVISQGKTFLNATTIANKFNLSSRKINMMLSEIGWIERYLKGWTITQLGVKNGGIQKENTKNGIPFVEWPESILNNKTFLNIIKEVQGDAGCDNIQENNESKNTDTFREKFEAKHRSTDGHFVRSKAEMLIDNWLYMAEIVHAYERKLPIEEDVYCDFYIPTGKVYIEFWGLENNPKYAERKKVKQEIYKKYDFKLIELTDEDVFNLDDVLPRLLLKFGVQTY